jgi:hypothetical protein
MQVEPDLLLLFATNPTQNPGLRAPSCKHVEITEQGALLGRLACLGAQACNTWSRG